jgi:hypothetical protein
MWMMLKCAYSCGYAITLVCCNETFEHLLRRGGCRRDNMLMGERERLFIDRCSYGYRNGHIGGNVYIPSLRLGGRKLPTYELMLRLLGVATMYGWILALFIMYKL